MTKEKKKRHRRTKAEMEAFRKAEAERKERLGLSKEASKAFDKLMLKSNRTNYTKMELGRETDRGVIEVCTKCGRNGAKRISKTFGVIFTHHTILRPQAWQPEVTDFCIP